MARLTVDEFHEAAKLPLTVVLDDVRSAHNVGSIFRTCDAFRVERIILCGITSTPPSAEIHKTALGAEDSVAWEYYPTAMEAVDMLHHKGYNVIAVEQCEGSVLLQSLTNKHDKRCAIILGNEVKGVHQEVIDLCDGCIEIPQYGTKHSLNISVAAGIVIWEIASSSLLSLNS